MKNTVHVKYSSGAPIETWCENCLSFVSLGYVHICPVTHHEYEERHVVTESEWGLLLSTLKRIESSLAAIEKNMVVIGTPLQEKE